MLGRSELEAIVAERTSMAASDVSRVIDAFIDEVVSTVVAGGTVKIAGLGAFDAPTKAERRMRHPVSGETIVVPAGLRIRYRPAKTFRDRMH